MLALQSWPPTLRTHALVVASETEGIDYWSALVKTYICLCYAKTYPILYHRLRHPNSDLQTYYNYLIAHDPQIEQDQVLLHKRLGEAFFQDGAEEHDLLSNCDPLLALRYLYRQDQGVADKVTEHLLAHLFRQLSTYQQSLDQATSFSFTPATLQPTLEKFRTLTYDTHPLGGHCGLFACLYDTCIPGLTQEMTYCRCYSVPLEEGISSCIGRMGWGVVWGLLNAVTYPCGITVDPMRWSEGRACARLRDGCSPCRACCQIACPPGYHLTPLLPQDRHII